jgi:hypothetical protein
MALSELNPASESDATPVKRPTSEIVKAARKFFEGGWPFDMRIYSLATVNSDGTPDVAPIMTFKILDDLQSFSFIHAFTPRSYKNIQQNPVVTVMAVNANPLVWLWVMLTGRRKATFGYRVTGRLREIVDFPPESSTVGLLRPPLDRIYKYMGPGAQYIRRHFKKRLIFDIIEVRKVVF